MSITDKTTEEILLEFKRVASGVSENIENPLKLLNQNQNLTKNGID